MTRCCLGVHGRELDETSRVERYWLLLNTGQQKEIIHSTGKPSSYQNSHCQGFSLEINAVVCDIEECGDNFLALGIEGLCGRQPQVLEPVTPAILTQYLAS